MSRAATTFLYLLSLVYAFLVSMGNCFNIVTVLLLWMLSVSLMIP